MSLRDISPFHGESPFSREPEYKKASLEKGGGPSIDGGGISMWNLLLGVKDLCNNPSVSLRLPAPFSREPDRKKASLEKGGGPSIDGGGILL